ncbi:DUF4430 domain-containing protein [Enterococcus sp. CSURQ0835]|uniref:DUF4430 domain-containing protein n=1 Tax=Enterococcus sp. CSURQ0835 TaxID=2681394 RepID=UPI001F2597D6|nr:DUF4430 domain-containing protein [Enterococcus sp. CSURQ0835]
MKKLLTLMALTLGVVAFSGCQSNDQSTSSQTTTSTSQVAQQKAVVTLQEEGKELTHKTIQFKAGTKLYDALQANFKIKAKDGYITSIDGHQQDDAAKKYWTFTINGKEIMKGAKDVTLKAGDKVNFNLATMK